MRIRVLVLFAALCPGQVSYAWGPEGHVTVATLAERLIAGTSTERRVRQILGDITLADASVWADCVKSVNPSTFHYSGEGRFHPCQVFETPQAEAAMEDFVRRNSSQCSMKPGSEVCHAQYHYADVAYQHAAYRAGWVGTRDDDVVAAVTAMAVVLKGGRAPSPFVIRDKREALLLIVHYVGDLHQPLHVGAVYLDPLGRPLNPDVGAFDPSTDTRGGNLIRALTSRGRGRGTLHAEWDSVTKSMRADRITTAWVRRAGDVAAASGPASSWAAEWGSQSVRAARAALGELNFGPVRDGRWATALPGSYNSSMNAIKETQLTLAGAHLAQLLREALP